ALVAHRLAGGQALPVCGNRDDDIGAAGGLEAPACLGDGRFGVVRGGGGNLQADIAVALAGGVVDGTKDVSGHLDVFDGQHFEDLLAIEDAVADQLPDCRVIVTAAVNGLLKDGWIGGDPDDRVFI